ncbi:hypothetical protein ACVWYN_003647 [Pedobacter sp. UYP24]
MLPKYTIILVIIRWLYRLNFVYVVPGFVYFVFVTGTSKIIYSPFGYTNDAEPIADGYRMDNRRTKPCRSQVLARPKAEGHGGQGVKVESYQKAFEATRKLLIRLGHIG